MYNMIASNYYKAPVVQAHDVLSCLLKKFILVSSIIYKTELETKMLS